MEIPIDAKVLYEMYEYAAYAHKHLKSEIAGWGHYHKDKGIYKLAPLLHQEAAGGDVETFPNGILNDMKYPMRDMIVQWHSHVYMSTFFSSVDITNIKDTMKLFPVLISIVVNCKNQYTARIDFSHAGAHNDITLPQTITLDVDLIPYYNNPQVNKEVKKKLHKPKPKPPVIISYPKFDNYQYNSGRRWNQTTQNWEEIPAQSVISSAKDKELETRVREYDLFGEDYVPPVRDKDATSIDFTFSEEGLQKMKDRFTALANKYPQLLSHSVAPDANFLVHVPTGQWISFDKYGMETPGFEGDAGLLDEFLESIGLKEEMEKKDDSKENSDKK